MKRNLKSEMKQSMDALRFSEEEKEAMVYDLLDAAEKTGRPSGKKFVVIALAACLVLTMLTGAAVYTRWSTTAQTSYNPSQDIKEQAEKSGLSVMLGETKGESDSGQVLSATDQGITITAVQSIVDNYQAQLTFRIEGFQLPEGKDPEVWPIVTIDGQQDFYVAQTGGCFDGTTRNKAGEWVYASNGQPVQFGDDEFQSAILDWVADDGSLEYTHYISFRETDGRYMGKEIAVTFHSIGVQRSKKAKMPEPQIEGNWELKWTLTGTGDNISTTLNEKIGDSDVMLLDAEIGQLSLRTRYQLKDYWEGWDELVEFPQAVCGVRMKDGSEHRCMSTTTGFEDQEKMIYFVQSSMLDAILDLSQVESLMFHKGWEKDANGKNIHTFYYIPVPGAQ